MGVRWECCVGVLGECSLGYEYQHWCYSAQPVYYDFTLVHIFCMKSN